MSLVSFSVRSDQIRYGYPHQPLLGTPGITKKAGLSTEELLIMSLQCYWHLRMY
jgi:hypothetical protein